MDDNRVVITGMGGICALGNDADTIIDNMSLGIDGITELDYAKNNNFPVKVAGLVKGFEFNDIETPQISRTMQLFLKTFSEAYAGSGFINHDTGDNNYGIIAGIPGNYLSTEDLIEYYCNIDNGFSIRMENISSNNWISLIKHNNHNALILPAISVKFKGFVRALDTACAASSMAIGEAYRILKRSGDVKVIAAGGSATLSDLWGITVFGLLKSLSTSKNKSSRPFDLMRNGFVMAEGAGVVILEELRHAKERNAPILCEVCGYGQSSSAYRVTDMKEDGIAEYTAMNNALIDAGIKPDEIDYIQAHGTSTIQNDKVETKAIKSLFKENSHNIPVSSIKSMIGHTISSSGVLQCISVIGMIRKNMIFPTINYENRDPECDLNYVPNSAIKKQLKYVMLNSFGFGGHNAVLILKNLLTDKNIFKIG